MLGRAGTALLALMAGMTAVALGTLAQTGGADVKAGRRGGDGNLPPLRRSLPEESGPDERGRRGGPPPTPPTRPPAQPRPPIVTPQSPDRPPGPGSEPIVTVTERGPRNANSVGTAFAIDKGGDWVTASHVVEECKTVFVNIKGEWIPATVLSRHSVADVAVVRTRVDAPPMAVAEPVPLRAEQDGFQMGYPQFKPGATHVKLIGRVRVQRARRGSAMEVAYSWAEVSRAPDFEGTLGGISGGPIVDARGVVVGVNILESSRRGRVTTSSPESIREAMGEARVKAEGGQGKVVAPANYGDRADEERASGAVARVFCAVLPDAVPPRVPRN